MNVTTKHPIDLSKCACATGSNSWSRYPKLCSRKASSIEQPRATLGFAYVTTKIGERSAYDIIMQLDTREEKSESLPLYGPVQPLGFCGQHSPAKKIAREQAKQNAERETRARKDKVTNSFETQAARIRELLGVDSQWDVQVAYSGEWPNRYADGVKITGRALTALMTTLERAMHSEEVA